MGKIRQLRKKIKETIGRINNKNITVQSSETLRIYGSITGLEASITVGVKLLGIGNTNHSIKIGRIELLSTKREKRVKIDKRLNNSREYTFNNLPPGHYKIVPYTTDSNSMIEPPSVVVKYDGRDSVQKDFRVF